MKKTVKSKGIITIFHASNYEASSNHILSLNAKYVRRKNFKPEHHKGSIKNSYSPKANRPFHSYVSYLAPVVQRLDNAIHRINHYPADSVVCFVNTYLPDSDLSGG